jgi:predicted component of type VI protein secretion system
MQSTTRLQWPLRMNLRLLIIPAAVGLLAGCGSSKPSFCSKVSDLKKSFQQIENINPLSTGSNSLAATVNGIDSNAKAVVSSAKSDFPSETSALSTSYDALKATVTQVADGQTNTATLVKLPGEVYALVTAVDNFQKATKSKCS